MFGWKKKKKDTSAKDSPSASSGFSSSLNNLLKGSPKGKKSAKYSGRTDILTGSQTSGSNSPHSLGERSSFISNGSASPSPSNNSNPGITSQFVHSLPPPEYSALPPPDHSVLGPKTSTPAGTSLRATYTPPPGYGILNKAGRPGSSASTISRQTLNLSVNDGVDIEFGGAEEEDSTTGASRNLEESTVHPKKPLEDWTEAEILQWLNDSDLEYFADIFQGCDVDGDYLSQVTEEDLIELDIEEGNLRKKLLTEIINLKKQLHQEPAQQDAEPSTDESSSVHFGDTDEEDLFPESPQSPALVMLPGSRPPATRAPPPSSSSSSSQNAAADKQKGKQDDGRNVKLSEEQRKRQDSDLSVLSDSEKRGDDKLSSALQHAASLPTLPFTKKKVDQWNERDIIHWLDSIHLGHLAQVFVDHSITGQKLADIDMSLLDEMEIDSSLEREKILSTLYDLSNPSSNTPRDDLMSVINSTSGYEKQKYIAAVSALQSDDPEDVHLLPPEDRDSLLSSPEKDAPDVPEREADGGKKEGVKSGRVVKGGMNVEDDDEEEEDSDWEDDLEDEDDDDDDNLEVEMMAVKKQEEERKGDQKKEENRNRDGVKRITFKGPVEDSDSESGESEDDEDDDDDDDEDDDEEEDAVEFFGRKQSRDVVKSATIMTSTPEIKGVAPNMKHDVSGISKLDKTESIDSSTGNDSTLGKSRIAKVTKQSSVEERNSPRVISVEPSSAAVLPTKESSHGNDGVQSGSKSSAPKKTDIDENELRMPRKASRSESNRSSGSEKEEKKKRGGLSKLKEVISPSNWKKSPRDSNTMHVWTDVGQSGSGSRTLAVKLTEESSTQHLITLCLTQLDLVEDPRLYRILQTSGHGRDKGNDRELEHDECPLLVQRNWSDQSNWRFEFRQRTAQGGAIKTVLRIPNQAPKGKLVSISLSTPASEVITLALKKFDLKNVDPKLFCLLEVDRDGDVCDVADEALPLQLDSHAFVLCDRSNRNLHWTTQEEEEANAEERRLKRQDSLTSRASSKMSSAVSLGSSFGSSELLSSTRIDNEKLSKLEKEMASIEESLVPVKDPPEPSSSADQVVTISPIPEIQINDQECSSAVQGVERVLELKKIQLLALREALGDLSNSYSEMKVEARLQALEQRLSSCPETDSLPPRLLQLLAELETASQEMEDRQREVDDLTQGIEELGGGLDDSTSAKYELTLAEIALLKAQFDHGSLLSSMEMAIADYQLDVKKAEDAKKKTVISPRGSATIYNTLPENQQFAMVALQASAGSQGFHFQLGQQNNQSGVYVQSCMPAGVMRVGDRVMEVNGHSVVGSSVLEVNTLLNRSKKAQLVLMRAGRDQVGLEVDRLTRQLATASEHYEACWQENKRLTDTVQRLRPLEHQILEFSQQKVTMQQLHQKIEALEARNQDISEELRMAHEGNINQSNQAISRLQGDKQRLETRARQQEQKIKQLEAELSQKNTEIVTVKRERDEAKVKSKSSDVNRNSEVKAGDLIADADNDTPLWEVLKPANKGEILQVLQEELEEAGRQKQYLDQLYSLMLQRAPELLEHLEQDFEASELSGSEEFC